MAKTTIIKTWVVGLIILVVGLLIGGISLGLLLANGGQFTPAANGNGYDFTPSFDSTFWTTVSFTAVGAVIALIGGVIQLVAWIGALINTYQIYDKTWFVILLIGGLLGLGFPLVGFAAMIVYLIAGPDGTLMSQRQPPQPATPSSTLAPTA